MSTANFRNRYALMRAAKAETARRTSATQPGVNPAMNQYQQGLNTLMGMYSGPSQQEITDINKQYNARTSYMRNAQIDSGLTGGSLAFSPVTLMGRERDAEVMRLKGDYKREKAQAYSQNQSRYADAMMQNYWNQQRQSLDQSRLAMDQQRLNMQRNSYRRAGRSTPVAQSFVTMPSSNPWGGLDAQQNRNRAYQRINRI